VRDGVLYLYAITYAEAGINVDVAGVHGAPVRPLCHGSLAAILSEHADLRLTPDADELWAHEAVLEAVMAEAPVLPMRLGSVVPDEAAVALVLDERRDLFEHALENVRGAVELGLRAAVGAGEDHSVEVAAVGSGGPGTTYLMERLGAQQRRDALGEQVHARLCELARRHTALSSSLEGTAVTAAYLVDVNLVDSFRELVEELQCEVDGVTLTCTGPWPPYSFTTPEPE
jgi:Gas vesicle synthesis protein GvpL/GvpF